MFKKIIKSISYRFNKKQNNIINLLENQNILISKINSNVNKKKLLINDLSEIEYSVFSKFGEDGIINWLINQIPGINNSFVEFGVENYTESNTRLIYQDYNWSGLIIDGDPNNINEIISSDYYWKGNLKAINKFVTIKNINDILKNNNIKKNLGILSIDIDGNDYWLWKSIKDFTPTIVICEFNSIFGEKLSLTVPYDKDFNRSQKHYSHLYFGCSINALIELSKKKGYVFLGTNLNGNNAFFIEKNSFKFVEQKIKNIKIYQSKFRESRNVNQKLDYKNAKDGLHVIDELPIVNLHNGNIDKIKNLIKYI